MLPVLRMPELRKDPITNGWITISAAQRRKRPGDFRLEHPAPGPSTFCPFCPGNEQHTPREILAYRHSGGPNGPGWGACA